MHEQKYELLFEQQAARELCAQAGEGAMTPVENVLYNAASDLGVALTGDDLDRSTDLLYVNNGLIDLRSG